MTRRSIITIFLFVLTHFANSQVSRSPITVEDVVEEFYKNYEATYSDGYVSFERRKNDWYVAYNKYKNSDWEVDKRYLFYDGKTKKFQQLKLEKKPNPEKFDVSDHINGYEIKNFNLQPYYGYDGWYKDVIKEYEKKTKLTDDELNCLARAYSFYAACLVGDNNGYAKKDEIWKLPFKMDCLTSKQIHDFESLSDKAIACFKKLADRNPSYETIVGKIGLKYSHEVVTKYSILLVYAASYANQMSLPANLYTSEQLEQSRHNLEACPPNAILFSYGDNDYYPVLYLQKAEGLRKDVYLVNASLLAIDRVILRINYPQFYSPAIAISVDTSFYIGNKNEVINLINSDSVFSISDLKILLSQQPDEFGYITLTANTLALSLSKKKQEDTEVSVKTNLDIKGARYFSRDQWILLDILENLNGRKICFQSLLFDEQLKDLNNHLEQKGDIWIYKN